MKNLIIGFGTQSRFEDFRVFVNSLRQTCRAEDVDAVIFIDQLGDEFGMLTDGKSIQLIPVTNTWKLCQQSKIINGLFAGLIHGLRLGRSTASEALRPAFDRAIRHAVLQWTHPQTARWIAIEDFIRLHPEYSRVFCTDVRDIAFQSNPFDRIDVDKLYVCHQSFPFGPRGSNLDSDWYANVYGEGELKKLEGAMTINSGTVYGGRGPVLRALALQSEEAIRHCRVPLDQAIFNHVIYNRLESAEVEQLDFAAGPVMIAIAPGVAGHWSVRDGKICYKDDVVPVVHMYDRVPEMKEHVVAMYAGTDVPQNA